MRRKSEAFRNKTKSFVSSAKKLNLVLFCCCWEGQRFTPFQIKECFVKKKKEKKTVKTHQNIKQHREREREMSSDEEEKNWARYYNKMKWISMSHQVMLFIVMHTSTWVLLLFLMLFSRKNRAKFCLRKISCFLGKFVSYFFFILCRMCVSTWFPR